MDDYTGRRIADVGREIYETAGIVRHVTGTKKRETRNYSRATPLRLFRSNGDASTVRQKPIAKKSNVRGKNEKEEIGIFYICAFIYVYIHAFR